MISQHFKNVAATALIVVTAFSILGTTVWGDIVSVIQKSKEQTIGVPIDRAVVIESAVPFAELSIANPAIADFSTLSDRTVYILGKLAGTTTLTLIDKKGNLISNVQIRVTTDLSELRKRLKEILPYEKIKVRSANDGIVLHGNVSTAEASDKAVYSQIDMHPI
jgi:pilus assembly protein CpaC